MIGRGVVGALRAQGIPFTATTRHPDLVPTDLEGDFVRFEAGVDDLTDLVAGYGPGDVVANCAGLIKQYIADDDVEHRLAAIAANAWLPTELARLAVEQGFRVVHITTDCVYSGATGDYLETDAHDAADVYGRSKSLGEVDSPAVLNLRCSIIGFEIRGFRSLLHWVLSHPDGATLTGYTDHRWNGLTADAYGRIVAGVVTSGDPLSGIVHVVPRDTVSKHELTGLILAAAGRDDVSVVPTATGSSVDRVLATVDPDRNARLWADAGYEAVPTIADMISELDFSKNTDGVHA